MREGCIGIKRSTGIVDINYLFIGLFIYGSMSMQPPDNPREDHVKECERLFTRFGFITDRQMYTDQKV